MTGPEHYAEAERLLMVAQDAEGFTASDEVSTIDFDGRGHLAAAQVHATLALAAATAYPAIVAYTGDEMGQESRGWANTTAPKRVSA